MTGKRASSKPDSHRVFGQGSGRRKTPCRAGRYARVSTHDQQTLPLQSRAMREYAARRGWSIVVQVREVGSGASERELREKLLQAARRREIDVVLVWRLDRWGRSVADLVATLQELSHLGVGFVSLTEALDLTTPSSEPWPGCWPYSPSSNARSCASGFAPAWPMPDRTGSAWDGRQRRRGRVARCGNFTATGSAKPRSRVASTSAAPRCAVF